MPFVVLQILKERKTKKAQVLKVANLTNKKTNKQSRSKHCVKNTSSKTKMD